MEPAFSWRLSVFVAMYPALESILEHFSSLHKELGRLSQHPASQRSAPQTFLPISMDSPLLGISCKMEPFSTWPRQLPSFTHFSHFFTLSPWPASKAGLVKAGHNQPTSPELISLGETRETRVFYKSKVRRSSLITSWQIDGETVETVADFILGGCR